MEGIPVAHKDIFCIKDQVTTCGSKMLENFVSPYSSISIEAFLHESPSLLAWPYMLNRVVDTDPAVLIAFGSRFLKART